MRKLTEKEFNAVKEIIESTEWVRTLVNSELNYGASWDNVMYQVAATFGIIEK